MSITHSEHIEWRLYNLYSNMKTPKAIKTTLKIAYQVEKWGINKFLALQYFKFKMIDTKPIMNQIHKLQVLVSKLRAFEVKIPYICDFG